MIRVDISQSLIDVAIQYTGDPSTAIEIAKENNLSMTDIINQPLFINPKMVKNKLVVEFFNKSIIKPATMIELAQDDYNAPLEFPISL
jgi:hypothetical protein